MSITLTSPIFEAGVLQPIGTVLSLSVAREAKLVGSNKAVYNYKNDQIRVGTGAFAKAANTRVNWVWHGHSVVTGFGSDDTSNGGPTNVVVWARQRTSAILGRRLNAVVGGTWSRGVEHFGVYNSGLFTFGGGAAISGPYGTVGIGGYRALLNSSSHTVSFRAVGTAVRIYMYSTLGTVLRYSINGGGTQSAAAAPNTPTPDGNGVWYEVTISGLTGGDGATTGDLVQLIGPTSSFVSITMVDQDYRTDAGLTLHALGVAGLMGAQAVAAYLDDTDTQPSTATNWIGTGATKAAYRLLQLQSVMTRLNASLVLNMFDVNDLKAYANASSPWGWTLTDHERHMRNYLTAVNGQGAKVLIVAGPLRLPSNTVADMTGNPRPFDQADLIELYKRVVKDYDAGMIDLTAEYKFPTLQSRYDAQQADGVNIDTVHPNSLGSAYFGNRIADAILAGNLGI